MPETKNYRFRKALAVSRFERKRFSEPDKNNSEQKERNNSKQIEKTIFNRATR